ATPPSLIFGFAAPVWQHPATLAAGTRQLQASGLFSTGTGPLNPTGAPLPPAVFAALHARLGPASALPPIPPSGTGVPLPAHEAHPAPPNHRSPDGRTVQYSAGLRAGDPGGTPALRAVPDIRATTSRAAASIGASDSGVGGEAPALYDISSISDSDLVRVIPIAILAIGVLLAV